MSTTAKFPYGEGPITVTMVIKKGNPMCKGNRQLHGKPTANGHTMWCMDLDANHYFVVANADVSLAHVKKYVHGFHVQRLSNKALLASYGPKWVEPEEEEPTVNPVVAAPVAAAVSEEEEYCGDETY